MQEVVQYEALPVSPTTEINLPFASCAKPANQKVNLPAVFKNAQFVDVEAYDSDASNPRVIPDYRHAIYNVEQSLKDWHRYAVVYERDRADLVFFVRKSRIASVTPRVEVGIGGRDRNSLHRILRVPQLVWGSTPKPVLLMHMLAIYIADPSRELSGPISSHSLKGGLDAPALPLFERIKHEVETHIRNRERNEGATKI